ncbi:MAG: hypothetical protein Q8L74_10515 [Nitrospirota bacterium]|nr:hypothetical protein [Nitrospirota bacterium]MDP2383227.1 hypothetical protein [Nitrospirota bacterium]MDP3598638.1 hypothetical protein [Nitrospirota bacterium]
MAVVIDEVIADVQSESPASEGQLSAATPRQPRVDVAMELRRLASRAARIHAD